MILVWLIIGVLAVIALHFTLKQITDNSSPAARNKAFLIIGGVVLALILLRFGQPALAFLLSVFIALTGLLQRLSFLLPLMRFFKKPAAAATESMTPAKAAQILGVSQHASPEDIKAAWHKLMQQCHPDKGGNEYLAQQLNAAKEVLMNQHNG